MGAAAGGGRDDGDRPFSDHAQPNHRGRSRAHLFRVGPGRLRTAAVGRRGADLRGHLRHPRRGAGPVDQVELSVRRIPRLDARSLFGRRGLSRPGRVLRLHRGSAAAVARAGDARRARGLVPGQLRAGEGAEPRLHLQDGLVPATGTGGRHGDRTHRRRLRALRGGLPAGGRDELHRAAADPRGVAAGACAATRARARAEGRDGCEPPSRVADAVSDDLFQGIAGHAQALGQLRSQVTTGRLAHAYLFVGESGLGKSTAARALAAALLPEAKLGRHPDYWEDDRLKPLSINEIRLLPDKPPEFHELSLQAFLNLKPAVGTRRVALLVNVGRIRDQDQGVLLKTLEEPHPHRVIVLTTPSLNPFVVLPTVVSRCQRVFFHPVPAPEIEKLLVGHGIEARRAGLVAELASGRPGWAMRRARDETVIGLHQEWTRRLEEIFGAPADVPLHVAAQLDSEQMGWRRSEGDEEDPALFAIASWQIELRRRMLAARGKEQGRWARLLELSYDTLGYLEQNVSPRLALETFLLECRKAS